MSVRLTSLDILLINKGPTEWPISGGIVRDLVPVLVVDLQAHHVVAHGASA